MREKMSHPAHKPPPPHRFVLWLRLQKGGGVFAGHYGNTIDVNYMVYLTFGILSMTGFNSVCSSCWLYCTSETNSQWVLATLAFTENNLLFLPGPISSIDKLPVAVYLSPFPSSHADGPQVSGRRGTTDVSSQPHHPQPAESHHSAG